MRLLGGLALGLLAAAAPGPDEQLLLQLGVTGRAAQAREAPGASAAGGASGRMHLWVWWDYGSSVAGYVQACRASWDRYAPPEVFDLHLVNASNVGRWLQDFPQEAAWMYPQAPSDIARAGLLAAYGGVYLDADMLLARPLEELTGRLRDVDVVTYSIDGDNCAEGGFSSNFMAARPGNEFFTSWYEEAKRLVKQRCPAGIIGGPRKGDMEPPCCYDLSGEPMKGGCHIPWGRLGEKVGKPALVSLQQRDPAKRVRFHCYNEHQNEGFAACGAECLWAPLNGSRVADGRIASKYNCTTDGPDLRCAAADGWTMVHRDFFGRRAYHLYSTIVFYTMRPAMDVRQEDLLEGGAPWVLSELLRRVLGSA